MKVLWFSNSPAAAYNKAIKGTGGWMIALDKAVQDCVELHVAYNYPYKQKPFQNGKTWYHPIFSGNIVNNSLLHRLMPNRHKDLTDAYLKVIQEVCPDIIHIHGSENSFHRIAGMTDIPIVLSIQGNPTVYAMKFDAGFHGNYRHAKIGNLTIQSLIFGRRSYNDDLRNLKWLSELEQKDFLKINYIIGRTDWDRRITRVLAPQSRYFIGNEALRDSFYNHEWKMDAPKDKIIIHTTNGDVYYKGFETICHTITLLNRMGMNIEWRVAGVSKESKINKITKKFLGKDYPRQGLILMGSLDERHLLDSLMTSHLYVMPSHIENSPNNLCEAMMLGMPCITTLAGGSDTILVNKQEGIVIQEGDPWSMAGAILELKNDWEQAVYYGHKAREHARQRHDKDVIVGELLKTYQIIIDSNKEQ